MDDVRDNGELLVLAQRRGLRIHEVPVDWVDDPDSRVNIVQTAVTERTGCWPAAGARSTPSRRSTGECGDRVASRGR